jgi:hypothetical protein
MDLLLAGKVLPFFKQFILDNFNMRQLFDFLNVLGLMIKIFQELTVSEMSIKVDKKLILCKITSTDTEESPI